MNQISAPSAIQVLVVDDSAVIRGLLGRWLGEDPGIEIVGSASNGERAITEYRRLNPDVVIMDIEMPVMDGISALKEIMSIDGKAKIVMSSTLTRNNADISIKALRLGASDYVAKPTARDQLHDKNGFQRDLIQKVKGLAQARRIRQSVRSTAAIASPREAVHAPGQGLYGRSPVVLKRPSRQRPSVLAIGSSTGGPQALFDVFETLKSLSSIPILITQHMPATFTSIFAEHLARISGRDCKEGEDKQRIRPGQVYIAPGDHHMIAEKSADGPILRITQGPPENFCRPAVDPMLRSLSQVYGPGVLSVIMTGMGHDGLNGSRVVVDAGGTVIAQDEATSVVWGMPGAVATGGLCSAILPLDEIGKTLVRVCNGGAL